MRTRKPARLFGVFVTLFMLAACAPLAVTPAPQAEPAATAPLTALVDPASATPIRILFIGDTQIMANQGLDVHLQHMAAAADPPLTVDASKIAYDQVTLAEIWAASDAATVIRQGDWDVVVLQNIGTRQAEEFETAVADFAVASAEAGGTPLILAHWDDVNDPQAEAAYAVGARLGIPVAPARSEEHTSELQSQR